MPEIKTKKEYRILTAVVPFNAGASLEDIFYALNTIKKVKYISFLDSSLTPNKFSCYSYLAWEPEFVIKSFGIKNEVIDLSMGTNEKVSGHPLKFLNEILEHNIFNSTEIIYIEDLDNNHEINSGNEPNIHFYETNPPDYKGGFIGYFSYDLKDYIEKLPRKALKDINVPIFYLCYYLKFLAFNHLTGKCYFIKNYFISLNKVTDEPDEKRNSINNNIVDYSSKHFCSARKRCLNDYTDNLCFDEKSFSCDKNSFEKSYEKNIRQDIKKETRKIFRQIENSASRRAGQKINDFIISKYKARKKTSPELVSNFSETDYIRAIVKAKQYIHNGDIYQANISQRFSCGIDFEPADLYYILRQKNSAPYCAYLGFPALKVGCSSPERFIFLKDRQVQTRPIKGTRPRGANEKEDKKHIEELRDSIKDRAELNMIVDLERNDLGRFCKYGSVKVKEHAVVEKYAKVFHLVSTVTGILQEGYRHTDIIKAAFPGGSITGAPKIRAMEIIDSIEPTARNIYTGSIGYISLDGTMDLNIAIRTFIIKNKKFYYNVGGGIVEDSIPESEYQETLDKGLALKETLEYFTQKLCNQ